MIYGDIHARTGGHAHLQATPMRMCGVAHALGASVVKDYMLAAYSIMSTMRKHSSCCGHF